MLKLSGAMVIILAACCSVAAKPVNGGRCANAQAQCAIEMGGTCDQATGRWRYINHTTGTIIGGSRFIDCIDRRLAGQKKK
jgi:hypothetical protein